MTTKRLDACGDVLFIDELAEVIGSSRRQINRLRALNAFPIPTIESIDRRARWSKTVVRQWLEGTRQPVSVRHRRVG